MAEKSQKAENLEDIYGFPIASVMKIVKRVLPENIQVAKESKQAFTIGAKMFVHFLIACANDICQNEGKAIITSEHVMKALDELELNWRPQLLEFIASSTMNKKRNESNNSNNNNNNDSFTIYNA